jgi:cell division protein FtsL
MATQAIAGQGWFESSRGTTMDAAERNQLLLHAQKKARRGPTPEVFFSKRLDNTRLVKAADPVRIKEMRLFSITMALLFVVVMLYGWQHLSSIEIGYKVEAEKQQLQQLQEQNRQLSLKEAQLCDLGRLDREARRMGMDVPKPGQVVRPEGSFDANGAVLAELR